MGKGIIKSGGADGFYSVELTFERESIGETISLIDIRIELLTSVIDMMNEGSGKELVKLERNSYIKKKEYLQSNMPEDPTVSAWCADLTEGITGTVGTIEVPGERGIVQIQPGYESNSTYDSIRDGQLQPSIASNPAATFYNLAMLPGWQKWKPTYRYGTISNIDTDANTCDVKLDEVESSQQNLDINQELNLTGISISYMSCNSAAFEDGDAVLVKFEGQDWSGAKVIGFKDNPKACDIKIKLWRGDGTLLTGYLGAGSEEDGYLITWLYIFDSNGDWVSTTTMYDSETGYWTLSIDNPEDKDPNGYWLEYDCWHGLDSQYPYRYKNQRQEADLIKGGEYIDIIPYSHISLYMTSSEDDCYAGLRPSFINDAVRQTINKLSVPYDIKYTIRENMPEASCMGIDWILESDDKSLSFGPIQTTWSWEDMSSTSSDHTPTVEIPLAIATEIAIILSANENPDWTAFNIQFSGIVIGEGGISSRTHTVYYKRNASDHEIAVAAWKEIETEI